MGIPLPLSQIKLRLETIKIQGNEQNNSTH